MGNTLLTPSVIAKESLIVLENECAMARLVHRAYEQEFQSVGSTVTIRKPTTFTSTSFSSTIATQDATESSVQVVLDQHLDVSFDVTTKDLSLKIVDFSEQFIQPAMRAHAQKIDELLCALYSDIATHEEVSSTPAVRDLADVSAALTTLKAPLSQRSGVLHPVTQAGYVALDAFLNADKTGTTKALREGSLGRVMGIDWYVDQNINRHEVDATFDDDYVGAAKGAWATSSTTGIIDALTDNDVIQAGDVFKPSGYDQWFMIVSGGTVGSATANELEVTFTPAVRNNEIADNTVMTFIGSHKANMVFHKNAFALVTAPLEPPLGGAKGEVISYNGLSCRAVYDYTMSSKKNNISIDLLCGVKTLDKDLAARLADTRTA